MAEDKGKGEVEAGEGGGGAEGDWLPSPRDTPTRATEPEAAAFLTAVAAGSTPTGAARKAGIHRATVYRWRDSDPAFRDAWDAAHSAKVDRLEDSVLERAMLGVLEDVYYQGQVVGQRRVFSDRLAELVLKAERPDKYRERVDHTVTAVPLSPEELAAARAAGMPPEVQAAARVIAALPAVTEKPAA